MAGFPVQNVYKMTYGDKNATFEPLNPWTVTNNVFEMAHHMISRENFLKNFRDVYGQRKIKIP